MYESLTMEGKIYGIYDNSDQLIYIGRTKYSVSKRFSNHKSISRIEPPRLTLYEYVNGLATKWDGFRCEILDIYRGSSKQEFYDLETQWIQSKLPLCNVSQKKTNDEKRQRRKEYQQLEHVKRTHKEWYRNNADKIREAALDRYYNDIANRRKYSRAKSKQYYAINSETIKEQRFVQNILKQIDWNSDGDTFANVKFPIRGRPRKVP